MRRAGSPKEVVRLGCCSKHEYQPHCGSQECYSGCESHAAFGRASSIGQYNAILMQGGVGVVLDMSDWLM